MDPKIIIYLSLLHNENEQLALAIYNVNLLGIVVHKTIFETVIT